MKILVVEDEESYRETLAILLPKEGHEVVVAADGHEALARFADSKPDLILLDLMLPGISGNEVCRTIRQTSNVPIIMLTARGEPMDRIVGLELGADDYLPKPFEPRELLARIRAILRRRTDGGTPAAQALRFGFLIHDVSRLRRIVVELSFWVGCVGVAAAKFSDLASNANTAASTATASRHGSATPWVTGRATRWWCSRRTSTTRPG